MTPRYSSLTRFEKRRLWLLVLVVAAAGAAVFAVLGLTGGGSAHPSADQPSSAPEPTTSPSPTPSAAAPRITPAPAKKVVAVADPMPRSVPTRLRIPAIGVDSNLMALGLKSDGTLQTPPGAFPAGWFTEAPTPGELGPAIIVGHVRYNTPGVFARLTDLRRADEIDVRREDGTTASFRVTRLEHFAKSQFPTQMVYGNLDHAGLRLITCGGLDASTNEFKENVVVFADLVSQ